MAVVSTQSFWKLTCSPIKQDTELQTPDFKLLWPNGSQWEPVVHSVTFQIKPCWHFYSDLFSVASVDTVQVQQSQYASKGLRIGSNYQNPYVSSLQVMSFQSHRINHVSCMENTWKSRSFLCSFPEGCIKSLHSIFSWNHNEQLGGLQEWKNLGSLKCSLHHLWAATTWLSKLWGSKTCICGNREPPPPLAKMCSCCTARFLVSSVFRAESEVK